MNEIAWNETEKEESDTYIILRELQKVGKDYVRDDGSQVLELSI